VTIAIEIGYIHVVQEAIGCVERIVWADALSGLDKSSSESAIMTSPFTGSAAD
jgi:hypothetical protein